MRRSLSGRLALVLTMKFIGIGALLVVVAPVRAGAPHWPELVGELVAGAIAFALLAALVVFNLFARRIRQLAAEIERFRAGDFTVPGRLAWARADGDEIDRLAHAVGEMSDRIARQIHELEALDGHRRELVANVSHDLRTPLTLMRGHLETLLLRHGSLTPAQSRESLEVAVRHAERLGRLVGDLFELATLEGRLEQVHAEPFSPCELAQDTVQKFALHASQRQIRLDLTLDEHCPAVNGDIGLIERALENLVENALRHTPPGGRVAVEVARCGSQAALSVRDTGCGIAHDNLPHLFERYFRAPRLEAMGFDSASRHTAMEPRAHHAGLGLAITQRIVALHGGRIDVSSTLGRGTAFRLELPLEATLATAAPRARTPARSVGACTA